MTRLANGTRKVWGLPVLWLWHRKPDPPQVIVVVVYVGGDPALRAATAAGIEMTPRKALPPGGRRHPTREESR